MARRKIRVKEGKTRRKETGMRNGEKVEREGKGWEEEKEREGGNK